MFDIFVLRPPSITPMWVANSTSIVPTQCIYFFVNNEMKGLGSGRIHADDMADMVRDAITPLEAIDEYVLPFSGKIN